MYLRIISYLIFAILVTGCKTSAVVDEPALETNIALPDWVDNPEYPGYVGITTSAQPQQMGGIEAQRRVAEMLARAEISRIKSSSVQSRSTIVTTSSNAGVNISSDDLRRVSSAQALRLNDVKIIEEWTHPETGELYMWLAYPVTP